MTTYCFSFPYKSRILDFGTATTFDVLVKKNYYVIKSAETNEPCLQINAQNCVHCKTCDIKDPSDYFSYGMYPCSFFYYPNCWFNT